MAATLIDPAPALCGAHLSLYFPYSKCPTPGAGGGLWRASALTGGAHTYARDFQVTAWLGPAGRVYSPDRIVDAYGSDAQYLNPDAIRMPDGSWRVYTGGGPRFDTISNRNFTLNLFTGHSDDGGCPWWE